VQTLRAGLQHAPVRRRQIRFDTTKPDGTPHKLMDVSRLADMGWRASIELEEGLQDAYAWFLAHEGELRGNEAH